ncbi:AraC family transcriptional regulator [Ensifer adhaerens]|uniref:helix-turn-helix domain-containing protein n=1 Tax=Ensifer adhaerens TaxID=106592 RepID=UPI001CBDC1AC|nr:AraC family transcriptional regulator [Ensifer adhaerens]MBZ7924168.1 AraC family transcriptional regulator [Ensifer adhaerens]UAX96573.1 AraC family transcriptional regulator [Ensifer adhaerens]UAY04083.1 AraC family transcriptional regulator [Ensifer adhaerens]UAY12069.1 AraC family transcriptional regulator [Ensifer adhaerens]
MAKCPADLSGELLEHYGLIDLAISDEVSRLVIDAINRVELDETTAIDLIKKAAALLRSPVHSVQPRPERVERSGLAPWQINHLKQYIEQNLTMPMTRADLAQVVRLSTSYFSVAFRVSFGTSPHNFLMRRRVERAKQRLSETDAPLSEIALDCGLADQAHLSRVFRRATGTTPSRWRRFNRRFENERDNLKRYPEKAAARV